MRNPTRRNRNIGTSRQGHGKNNKLVIPRGWDDSRVFWEKIENPVPVERVIMDHKVTILVEPTQPGFMHACTIDDVARVLSSIPIAHLDNLGLIVLRQPKKKENILDLCWGRLGYWANIGKYSGPAIYLEAKRPSEPVRWSKSLTPGWTRELERLIEDGHLVIIEKRGYIIKSTLEATRATQLYRTLPHEIGHYVDYMTNVHEPLTSKSDNNLKDRLEKRYMKKPELEMEAFAHRYADEFRTEMTEKGIIPFPRVINERKLAEDGLDLGWFGLTSEIGALPADL